MADQTKTMKLKKQKDTTGTVVYTENAGAGQPVRTVYVNKGTWEPMPNEIELSIKPVS